MTEQEQAFQIRIPGRKKDTLLTILSDWLERLKDDLSRRYTSNAPTEDVRKAEVRAHTFADFVRSVVTADHTGNEYLITHTTEHYDILSEEVERLYVDMTQENRSDARQRVDKESVGTVIQLIVDESNIQSDIEDSKY